MGSRARVSLRVCARCVSNMDPGRARPFAMSGDNAQPRRRVGSFLALLGGSRMPIVGRFFRPGGELGGVMRPEHARFAHASPHIIFPPETENENMATHSSREGKPPPLLPSFLPHH